MPTPQTPIPTYKGSQAEKLVTDVLAGIKKIKSDYPLAKKSPDLKKPDPKDKEAIARHKAAVEEYQQARAKHAEVVGIVDTLAETINKGLGFISYVDKKKVITKGDLPLIAAANPFSIKFFMSSAFEDLLKNMERINGDPKNFHPMYAAVLELLVNVLQKAPQNYDEFAPFINPEVANAFVPGLSIQENYNYWLGKLKDDSAVLLAQYKGSPVKPRSRDEEKEYVPDNNVPQRFNNVDLDTSSSRSSAEDEPQPGEQEVDLSVFPLSSSLVLPANQRRVLDAFLEPIFEASSSEDPEEPEEPISQFASETPPLTPVAVSPAFRAEEKQAAVEDAAPVPASQAVAQTPVLFANEEKDNLVEIEIIAATQEMLKMQQGLAKVAQQRKEELETKSAAEAAEIGPLSKKLKQDATTIVEAVIEACTKHNYLLITSQQQAVLRAFTPLEEAGSQRLVVDVLQKTKEIASKLARWENVVIALRELSGQIAANQAKDVKQFFAWLKDSYPEVGDLGRLLDILEIKAQDKDNISSVYARFLSPFQKTSGEELLPIKQLLEKQVKAKIEKLSPLVEKARHAADFHPKLNRMNEAYQADLENLHRLHINQPLFQEAIRKQEEASQFALAEAEKSKAVHALLERIKQFKDNFNAFKLNPSENALDALSISNAHIQALGLEVAACEAESVHDETLGWMKGVCSDLQIQVREAFLKALMHKMREYDNSMQSFTSPATAEIQARNAQKIAEMEGFLSSEILSNPRLYVAPEGFDELLRKVRKDLNTHKATNATIKASTPVKAEAEAKGVAPSAQVQPQPQAAKSKSCCAAFLLKVLASPTLRKIALVVMIVSAVGIVVGGLALGGVGGVAAALGMGLLAAQITTGASAGAFALSTATFFGSRREAHKKRDREDSFVNDARLAAEIIPA